jgi:hypothetical protein
MKDKLTKTVAKNLKHLSPYSGRYNRLLVRKAKAQLKFFKEEYKVSTILD